MKEFIRYNWGLLLLIGLFFGFIIFIGSFVERRNVGGVILEHNVTASSSGYRTYSTIVKTDDGYIEEKTGLELYAAPIGNRVTIEVTRTKHKKH